MAAHHAHRTESKHPADHTPKVWDTKIQPIMDMLLSGRGPKLGNAAEVGRRAVRYMRPKDILVWLWKNWDEVIAAYEGDAVGELLKLNDELSCDKLDEFPDEFDADKLRPKDMIPLVELLIRKKFIYRADRHEVKVSARDEDAPQGSDDSAVDVEVLRLQEKDRRWPKKLLPYPIHATEGLMFDLNSVYVVAYERTSDKQWSNAMLVGFVIIAFIIVGYPAWPLWAKEYIAYVSVGLLSLLMFISVLRLITFVLLWYCGYDFWIMPNLWADDLGLLDIFRPLYSFSARNDGKAMYVVRVIAFVMMCLSFVKLSETHSLSDIGEFATTQYLEFVDWGVNKMTGQGAELAAANNTNFGAFDLQELLREEEEDDEDDIIDDIDDEDLEEDDEEEDVEESEGEDDSSDQVEVPETRPVDEL